ncbi:MAG TPA: ester cyclase [Kofleriaceae bacterium]
MNAGDRYRELARRLFTVEDDSAIDEWFAEDYEGEYGGERVVGRDRFKQSVLTLRAAIGPLDYQVHHTAESGDLVWAHWTARGTHRGPIFDIAPTGKPVVITGLTLNRIANGKIVWGLVKWDRMALLEQLR